MKKLLLLLAVLGVKLFAQPSPLPQILYVTTPPIGSCTVAQPLGLQIVISTLVVYGCEGTTIGGAGTWVLLSSGGGGGPTPTPGYQPNEILSGCGVEYVSGLTFNVGACTYTILGATYTSAITSVTLAAADPSNPRIDVIGVDNTGSVFSITGTPAASPSEPSIDPSTQLGLIFVTVAANATTPSGIATTLLYDENTEWTCTASAHINCASTSNPYRNTHDIEATAAVLGNNFTLVKPASGTTDLSTQNLLIFYIRSKGTWPSGNGSGPNAARTLSLFWLNGATQVGTAIVINQGAFGFNSSLTTAYQQIAIPTSIFGTGSNVVTTLKAQVTGNGGSSSFGWYIDAVSLQSGTNGIPLPTTLMNFKGTWNATASYNPNDTVVFGNIGYVALVGNTNVSVGTTSTWAPLAPSSPLPYTLCASGCNTTVGSSGSTYTAATTKQGLGAQISCWDGSNNRTDVGDANSGAVGLTAGTITLTYAGSAPESCVIWTPGGAGATGPPGTNGAAGPAGPAGPINTVGVNGTTQTVEPRLNLKAGTNVTITGADNSGTTSTDVTITSAGGSVFNGSTATAPSFSATPTFSLADVSVKSPLRVQPGAMTANVTSVTFTNTTAGAKFSIVWLQDATGGRTVTYGGSTVNTCTVSPTASVATTQQFEVSQDGTTVVGTGCTTNDAWNGSSATESTAPAGQSGVDLIYADSASHQWKANNNNGGANTFVFLEKNATFTGTVTQPSFNSTSNCTSSASPAACGSAPAGSIAIPTGVSSVVLTVNTTAVTANSQIFVFSDDSLGAKLGVTCNSTLATLVGGMAITGRVAATSFTVTYNGTIATNPLCASFLLVN